MGKEESCTGQIFPDFTSNQVWPLPYQHKTMQAEERAFDQKYEGGGGIYQPFLFARVSCFLDVLLLLSSEKCY